MPPLKGTVIVDVRVCDDGKEPIIPECFPDFTTERVPVGFNPMDHISPDMANHAPKAQTIVSKVTCDPHTRSRSGRRTKRYTPLPSKEMAKLCGKGKVWTEIHDSLLESVLETDGVWSRNNKSLGYRLAREFDDMDTVRVPQRDTRVVELNRAAEIEIRKDWETVHRHLCRFLFELDVDAATLDTATGGRSSRRKRLARTAAQMIAERRVRLKPDPYGRVQTSVTNLWSPIRRSLRWKGQSLAEIDVANCQPLLIGVMAAQVESGCWTVDRLKALGVNAKLSPPSKTKQTATWLRNLREGLCGLGHGVFDRGSIPLDLRDYIEVCESGRFYEELARVWRVDLADPRERDKFKKLAMKLVFFGKIRRQGVRHYDLWKSFCDRWPSVGRLLVALKERDKGVAARASQKIEANLVIHGACERLMKAHPLIPLVTVHDSILTTPENAENVSAALTEAFAKVGVKPRLRTKNFGNA